ncbi:MAG: HflK protein [Sphingomonadales bacterium 32-68-7]|nr:MAG: HflK protein [Sphingomonadales bacterium 12-68-11]OYX09579.1 MAG: HflK protein [Sphingomonadales bacterium 32-68-7]
MAGKRSPWGKPGNDDAGAGGEPGDGGNDSPPPSGEDSPPKGPRNPWLPSGGSDEQPRRSASIEDIFRNRGPEGPRRKGGGGGGPNFRMPRRPGGGSWYPFIVAGIVGIWLFVSSVHQVGPKEQAIVTTFGKYSRTLQPGLNFTLPWPLQMTDSEQVSEFRVETIPDGDAQRLMLTGDQNLVDLSYNVRWNIKDLQLYRFQLNSPEEAVQEVAEAAMRAEVAEKSLDQVFSGAGRADIELRVLERMQALLDAYRSGIAVQGVQIRKTDPPQEVEEAFKNVSAAQQDAESYLNQAEAAAQQVLARAEGDASAFDQVYEQYRLAPEVTRRRMYYETMERVLRQTDKTIVEGTGVTPYLPLPEVRRRAATPAPGAQ